MKPKFNLDLTRFNPLKRFSLKPKSAAYLMLATFFLVGGIYFIVVNVVATKGNEMGSLEKSNRDLQGENQRLEVEAARLKSLQVIDEGATGTVNVGNTTNTTTDTPTDSATQPAKPKIVTMVPSQHYTYLPSYTTLARR